MKHQINKGFIVQKVGSKTTIFDGERSALYTFNETASYIFSKIKASLTEQQIVQALVKRYGIKTKIAKNDFKQLLSELKKKKILKDILCSTDREGIRSKIY